ncbi:MAG: hypothetical protein U0354_06220 [Candidatus Sericytochromatia bacterium]
MLKIVKSVILLLSLQISSCAILVKDNDLKDYNSTMKIVKDAVNYNKYNSNQIKKIAVFGFYSSVFAGDNSNSTIMGVDTSLINTINDAASQRGCIALDKTYEMALKTFKEYGFEVLDSEKLKNNKTYMSLGAKDFPSLCTSGNTRINFLPPEKEMNQLFDELGVDALLTFSITAENDTSTGSFINIWTKGQDKAILSHTFNLGRQIKVESNTNFFFSDLQELAKTNDQKVAITARVYMTAFRLLAAKMYEELSKK